MKNQLIAALVGGLILFTWQFLSNTALNIHGAEQTYTPNQEKILECISQNLTAEGQYYLPTIAPGTTAEEQQAFMDNMAGKPWAQINYHSKFEMNLPMNLFRGFIIDFFAVFLLVWMFMKMPGLDMKTAVLGSLAVGAIGYMTIPYLNSVWYEITSIPDLIDTVVQWGLVGVWLGWWLTRK